MHRGETDQHQGKEQRRACEQEGELKGREECILLEDRQVLSFKGHRLFCTAVFVPVTELS